MRKSIRIRRQNCLIGSDYSAQEPRLMSSISGERILIEGYNLRNEEFPRGKDFYAQLASAAFNMPYWDCVEFRQDGSFNEEGKKRRSKAKGINLGINYGMGSAHLAQILEVDFEEAKKILNDFFSTYRDVKTWKDFNMQKMKAYGFMETILGRRRRLPDVFLKPVEVIVYSSETVDNVFPHIFRDYIRVVDEQASEVETSRFAKLRNPDKKKKQRETLESMGYRVIDNGAFLARTSTQCTNSVIQGSAADTTKLAMIKIYENEKLRKWGAKLRFLVHDEILIECPIVYRKQVAEEFVNSMLIAPKEFCSVDMICDAETEVRWKQGHTVGAIQKLYKNEGLEAVYKRYSEFNQDDLSKIVEDKFDVETEVLRYNEKTC